MKNIKFVSASVLALTMIGLAAPAFADVSTTTDNTVTFTSGALSLDGVSSFDFGTHPLSATNQTYVGTGVAWATPLTAAMDNTGAATTLTTGIAPINTIGANIQVTDVRGSNAGWKVQVLAQSGFSTDAATPANGTGIKGSVIHLTAGTPQFPSTASAPSVLPPLTLNTGSTGADSAGAQTLIKADQSSDGTVGAGTTSTPLSAKVDIPAGSALAKSYTAVINWNLAATPN